MPISAAEMQAKVDKTSTNMDRLDGIVNGSDTAEIATDNGLVPSFAKALKTISDAVEGDLIPIIADTNEAKDAANAAASAASAAAIAANTAANNAEAATEAADLATAQADYAATAALAAAGNAQPTDYPFIATDGQTDFVLPFTLTVPPIVYRNGSRLTASGVSHAGATVTLATPADADDEITITVGEAVLQPYTTVEKVVGLEARLSEITSDDITSGDGSTVEERLTKLFNVIRRQRVVSLFDYEFMSASEIEDVTSGDPVMDVSAQVQSLVDFCDANGYSAHIPQIYAKLGSRITSKTSTGVTCDSDGILKWTNTGNCGWRVTGSGMGDRPGYCTVNLPQMIGPNPYENMEPGGNKDFTAATMVGVGFQADNLIWSNFSIQQTKGWGTGVKMLGGAVPTDNNSFEIGTVDLCKYGLMVESPSGAAFATGQSRFRTMNIMSLFPLYLKATPGTPGIFECDFDCLGLTTPETGGTTIYLEGSDISDVRVRGKARNGYASNDSPAGTSPSMRGPIVGGNGFVGLDGGWAVGTRNSFNLYLDDFEPAFGNPLAFKVRGPGSRVRVEMPQSTASNPYAAIGLSSAQGEANYNGGVGGASVNEVTRVTFSVSSLAPGSVQTFYLYHQLLNPDNISPLEVVQIDNIGDLQIYTENNGPAVPREAKIKVRNPTSSAITQAVNLWVRVR